MKIGIDIDGVLTNLEQFGKDFGSKYLFQKNMLIRNEDFINKFYNMDTQLDHDFWSKAIFDYLNIKARPFASEIIDKLKEENNQIIIITNRVKSLDFCDINAEDMKRNIIEWLKENNIHYDELIFSNGDKKSHIIENNIDVMIDDIPRNINTISEVIPVICYDAVYNRDCNTKKVYRCYSWYDIYSKIKIIQSSK
jgi:uncharacterized HAD superfamily protein